MPLTSQNRKLAIVTGGGKGIGLAIAHKLVDDEYQVVVVDVDHEAGQEAAQRLGADRAFFCQCDIGAEQEVVDLFRVVAERYGVPDVVVNNAGILRDHVIWKMSADEFDSVLRVNLRGTWLMCRESAIAMRSQSRGAIVNIASRALLGNPGQTNYSASKAGVVGLTRALALELGRYNVRVNAVAPGLIDTPMTQGLTPEVREKLIGAQPTRSMGRPEDVADAVAFLASDNSRFMTGQVLYVDGGKSIANIT